MLSLVSTILTGSSRAEQVYENLDALKVYRQLTDADIEEIEKILDNKPNYNALF